MRTEARGTGAVRRVPPSRYLLFALLVAAGLSWDLYSKHVVFTDLGYPAGAIPDHQVPGAHQIFRSPNGVEGQSEPFLDGWVDFRLWTSFNHGALWGMGQGLTWMFAALSVLAVLFVSYWLFVHGAARSLWLTISLGLIMAGTLGNLYDRLALHGYTDAVGQPIHAVRDFLLFRFGGWPWPVFNFADVFLVSGATMLVVQSFLAGAERETVVESPPVQKGAGSKVSASS